MYEEMIAALREYASDCGWGDENCSSCSMSGLCEDGFSPGKIADAMEELNKRVAAVTAERDAAMNRLCEWCGVGCSMESRRAELCEIAAVGWEFINEYTSPNYATVEQECPTHDENGQLLYYPSGGGDGNDEV